VCNHALFCVRSCMHMSIHTHMRIHACTYTLATSKCSWTVFACMSCHHDDAWCPRKKTWRVQNTSPSRTCPAAFVCALPRLRQCQCRASPSVQSSRAQTAEGVAACCPAASHARLVINACHVAAAVRACVADCRPAAGPTHLNCGSLPYGSRFLCMRVWLGVLPCFRPCTT